MAEVKVTVKNVVEGSKDIKKAGNDFRDIEKASGGLNSKLEILKNSFGAVAGAAVTFRQAFEFGKQGLEIDQLAQSFDNMNASILHTPGLLEDMSHAVRGTVSDVELMQGVLKLTAGASDEASRRFAEASPRLAEIAKAANKLNPTLGSTAFLFDSISTGIKRGSPLILDNLGLQIKLGEANEAYAASLGKTVEQLTNEEKTFALLNATMEAGDQLIQQAGGNVDSAVDSYDRLEVEAQQLTNTFKSWLGEGLLPTVQFLNGDYSKAMVNAIERTDDFQRQLSLPQGILALPVVLKRIKKAYDDGQISQKEYTEFMLRSTLNVGKRLPAVMNDLTEAIEDNADQTLEAADADRILTRELEKAQTAAENFTPTVRDLSVEQGELADKIAQSNAQLSEAEAFTNAANIALRKRQEDLLATTEETRNYNTELARQNELLDEAINQKVTMEQQQEAFRMTGEVVKDLNDELTIYNDKLLGIPPSVETTITANVSGAISEVDRLMRKLGGIGGPTGGGGVGVGTFNLPTENQGGADEPPRYGSGSSGSPTPREEQPGTEDFDPLGGRGGMTVNNFNFNNMPVSPAVVSQQVANSFGGAAR